MVPASTIRFSNIATNGFTVSWSEPSGYLEHVSSYNVSWDPSSGEAINTNKMTTANITNLTPGQVYNVTITTQNDVTEASTPRTVSASKEQSASKLFIGNTKEPFYNMNYYSMVLDIISSKLGPKILYPNKNV